MKKLSLRIFLYSALSAGAIVVLLPLLWMVVAACKQTGQAMEFRFWPSSTVEGPDKSIIPIAPGKALMTFEYDPALFPELSSPSNVYLASDKINNWTPGDGHKLKQDGRVFTLTMALSPGHYSYRFFVGDTGTPDLANPERSEDGKNSLLTVSEGHNSNKPLTDATKIEGTKIFFHIARPGSKTVSVKLDDGRLLPLIRDEAGNFTGEAEVAPGVPVAYHTVEPQSLAQGWKKMYTLNNFLKVLKNDDFPFGRFFLNSLVVAAGSALLTVILCTMGGYVFAKKNFLFKRALFLLLISTMMIPGMIFMVPQFAIVNKLHWINSYQGMIVPHLANIFGLFLLTQYISTIPDSLFEAARIDGAGELDIMKIIIIPLSTPIMMTLFLLTFVGQWGNFLWQLIVNTPDSAYRTLPVGLALFKGQYSHNWEMLMAGACFSIIPIAILFLLAQRFFIEGMTGGAVKE